MTSKLIELLLTIGDSLDLFLDKVADTMMYGEGIGNGTLEYFGTIGTVVFLFLSIAFIINVMEAVLHQAKHLGDAHRGFPWQQFKKGFFILLVTFMMLGAKSAFSKNPENGTWMGIGYRTIVQGLSRPTMNKAMNTLVAVDVVADWTNALIEFDYDRRFQILQAIAKKDPSTAETYAARTVYLTEGVPLSMLEKLKTLLDLGAEVFSGDLLVYIFRYMVNTIVWGATQAFVIVATLLFVFQAARTILVLAFFVKLSTLLTIGLVPAAIGLLYFERMRHFGTTILKHLLVLNLAAGLLGGAVQVAFSNDTIKDAISISMRTDLRAWTAKVTDEDILSFETRTDLDTTLAALVGNKPSLSLGMVPGTFSTEQGLGMISSTIKIQFLLGSLLMLISKIFDVISGILTGHWDPFAEGTKASG